MTGAWCRACGIDVATDRTPCPDCGTPIAGFDFGPTRVGLVVALKGMLRTRNAVVLDESQSAVTVVIRGNEQQSIPHTELASLTRVTVPDARAHGAAGRLFAVAAATAAKTLDGNWDLDLVHRTAMSQACRSIGIRRVATLDCLACALPDIPAAFGLPPTELAWLRAYSACAAGAVDQMLTHLETLPAGRYRAAADLLLAKAPALLADCSLGIRAFALLERIGELDDDARMLRLALSPQGLEPTDFAAVRDYANAVADLLDDPSLSGLAAVVETGAGFSIPVPARLRAAAVAYAAGRTGACVDDRIEALGALPQPLIDQLLDRGALRTVPGPSAGWPSALLAHVTCRLQPGQASADQLAQTGFLAEAARRAYLAGDRDALARLPRSESAVRHYQALLELRTDGRFLTRDIRPELRTVLETVHRFAEQVRTDRRPAEIPPPVAGDPRGWFLLEQAARDGLLTITPEIAQQHPACAAWLQLRTVQRQILGGDWDDVGAAARALADRATADPVRAEALNMAAFTRLQTDDVTGALTTLDEALAAHPSIGLLINAALVATGDGSSRALAYLDRVHQTSTDPVLQRSALERAIAVWGADPTGGEVPPAVLSMVKRSLSRPQDDAFHRNLLRIALFHARPWLAATAPGTITIGPGQHEAVDYYRLRARYLEPTYPENLTDLARRFIAMCRPKPLPEWVDHERLWFNRLLADLAHSDLGAAAFLADPVEVVAGQDLMPPEQEIVLLLQVAGHCATRFLESNSCLTEQAEQRWIFEPVSRFNALRQTMPPARVSAIADEVTACFFVTMACMNDFAGTEMDRGTARWNQLAAQRNGPEGWTVSKTMGEILDQQEMIINRCLRYSRVAGYLAMDEERRDMQHRMERRIADWAAEIARLRRMG